MFEDSETQGNSKQCDSGGSEPNITRVCLQRHVSSLCIQEPMRAEGPKERPTAVLSDQLSARYVQIRQTAKITP